MWYVQKTDIQMKDNVFYEINQTEPAGYLLGVAWPIPL